MPQPVRSFHIVGDQFSELEALPEALPPTGYLWVATTRSAFEAALPEVQGRLQAWTGAQLFELHILDLLNTQRPSSYDYTSAYDILVFRRLAAGAIDAIDEDGPPAQGRQNAIGMKGPLRVGMERPVAVVVDVVDAERGAPVAVETVLKAHVGDEEGTEAGEREAVRVRVVELPVLSARVANAEAARPVLVG